MTTADLKIEMKKKWMEQFAEPAPKTFNTIYDPFRPLDYSFTDITVVLDRSGSMGFGNVRQNTINGFNEFLGEQKSLGRNARISLHQFNTRYETVYNNLPIDSAKELNTDSFIPIGNTALNDAVGQTIDILGLRLAEMPERSRPDNVVVVIITDGEENSSKHYTTEKVASMVKHQKEKYNWTFIFIGANQDAVLTGKKYNFNVGETITYNQSRRGTNNVFLAASKLVSSHRTGVGDSVFSASMREDAMEEDDA